MGHLALAMPRGRRFTLDEVGRAVRVPPHRPEPGASVTTASLMAALSRPAIPSPSSTTSKRRIRIERTRR
jgi:hypothetical protein